MVLQVNLNNTRGSYKSDLLVICITMICELKLYILK